jgi:hypothetical protein
MASNPPLFMLALHGPGRFQQVERAHYRKSQGIASVDGVAACLSAIPKC